MQKMKFNIQLFASGTIDGSSTASNCDCRIIWNSSSDNNNNSSSVTVTVQIKKSGSSQTTGTFKGSLIIDDISYSVSKYDTWDWGGWLTVATKTKNNINHDVDGSKKINISCSLTQTGTSMAGTYEASGTATLDKINRASVLGNINNFNISNIITIPITKYITSAIDNLQIKLGDVLIKSIANIEDGYVLTFTESEQNNIKSLSSSFKVILSFNLSTTNEETLIGTSNQNVKVNLLDIIYFREVVKKENNNYQVAFNGIVNEEAETFQIYDDNGNDLLFYQKEDTFEVKGDITLNGLITSSKKDLYITLYLPKRLDNINSITVNSLSLELRGINGYLNNQSGYNEYVNNSDYTIIPIIASENSVCIRLTKNSEFSNATNNTPIAGKGKKGSIKLTFN